MQLDDYVLGYLHHTTHADNWHRLSVTAENDGHLTLMMQAGDAHEFHVDMATVCSRWGRKLHGDKFVDRLTELEDGQVPGQQALGLARRITPTDREV